MDIKKILSLPESKTLEFKRDLTSIEPILKTLVAFANTAGGTIVIGVTNRTKQIVGVSNVLDNEERITNKICPSPKKQVFMRHSSLY